ncbi:hypothetical protein SASPL_155135 [Salvia splendens]|uniref:DhaK domain-containing protein n=1 Tax=Salvia splendens TaxID=180675 RepID=A0A8X8W1E1_SALSN|nr:hypothetical protein SASPL_155135 [Salvia splendens]
MVLKPETPINPINKLSIMINGLGYMSRGLDSGISGLILQGKRHLDLDRHIPPRRYVNGGRHSKKGVNRHITWWRYMFGKSAKNEVFLQSPVSTPVWMLSALKLLFWCFDCSGGFAAKGIDWSLITRRLCERDNIVRRRGSSVDEFTSSFEELNKPVLLEGCLKKLPAVEKWDREYLIGVCGDAQFSVGPVQMKLGDYFRYSDQVKEERPLYLFNPKFAEKVPKLGMDYGVPEYSSVRIFLVFWGARGRTIGSKKWVLFPPHGVPSNFPFKSHS